MKQTLGWTAPKIRRADTADLWTWLIIAAHTQLRLARRLAEELKRPWERKTESRRLTPPASGEVSQRPSRSSPSHSRTETVPTRTGTPSRLEEQAPGHPSQRRQDSKTRRINH
ncbi:MULTISPECIES: hypothetical protein [Streptomyces albidoflavus group]|uniref:hypothetical protein n=1 Tax=Streptomyces TaxID=1883 RepID=UPI001F3EAE03|nr:MULTISPECIES: hypothetical protein [Streptomyces]